MFHPSEQIRNVVPVKDVMPRVCGTIAAADAGMDRVFPQPDAVHGRAARQKGLFQQTGGGVGAAVGMRTAGQKANVRRLFGRVQFGAEGKGDSMNPPLSGGEHVCAGTPEKGWFKPFSLTGGCQ